MNPKKLFILFTLLALLFVGVAGAAAQGGGLPDSLGSSAQSAAAQGLAAVQFPILILHGFRGVGQRQDFRLLLFCHQGIPI